MTPTDAQYENDSYSGRIELDLEGSKVVRVHLRSCSINPRGKITILTKAIYQSFAVQKGILFIFIIKPAVSVFGHAWTWTWTCSDMWGHLAES